MTSEARTRYGRLLGLVALLSGICGSVPASHAQTFHVKDGDVEKGSWEVESINAWQARFPVNANRNRTAHELGLAYGISDYWKVRGLLDAATPDGEHLRATRFLVENEILLKPLADGQNGVGLAWFQTLEVATHHDETNATIFGPIARARLGKVLTIVNPFFEKTFGQNHTPGLDFVYGWQTRAEVVKDVAVGVELYGRIPDIGNAPPVAFQEHRIGPVLVIEAPFGSDKSNGHGGHGHDEANGSKDAGHGSHAELEIGMLFGLTEATSRLTGKANLHFKF